jgi:hypothetical protein
MHGKIIPFGYSNGGITELERLMSDEWAYLVDIRLSPRSKFQAFNQEALQARFHSRYIPMPELGNVNYRNDQPIRIAHPDRGIARLMNGIRQGYTIVLMCGCKQYASCHRRTVINLLTTAMPDVSIEMPDETSPADTIKCLSIMQPWAHLIVNGFKDIENRDWTTSYRGLILIHAGARFDPDCVTGGSLDEDFASYVTSICGYAPPTHVCHYPVKSLIGVVQLVDVVTESTSPWFIGRYGFVLRDALPFKEPIPYSGSLKLFDVPWKVITHAEVRS